MMIMKGQENIGPHNFFAFQKKKKDTPLLLGAIVLTRPDTYKNLNVSQCQRR